jgi:hypothetical protein
MAKVVEKLTVLVECKEASHLSFEEKQPLIDMHLAELDRLGVQVVNASFVAKLTGDRIHYPQVLVPDTSRPFSGNGVLLLDGEGEIIPGQKDIVINASFDCVVTATVTFVIGGFVTEQLNGSDE